METPTTVFHASTPLTHKELLLKRRLEAAYTPELLRTVLRPLITHESPVSLRALDWCVTNWAKQHNVVCTSVQGESTNVHYAYRTALGFWRRKLFDPFRRRARVRVRIDAETHETTLGQANFALWSYNTGVLGYALGHYESIEQDMNAVSQRQKRSRREAVARGVHRKRSELTHAPKTICVAYFSPTRVEF